MESGLRKIIAPKPKAATPTRIPPTTHPSQCPQKPLPRGGSLGITREQRRPSSLCLPLRCPSDPWTPSFRPRGAKAKGRALSRFGRRGMGHPSTRLCFALRAKSGRQGGASAPGEHFSSEGRRAEGTQSIGRPHCTGSP